MSNLNISAAGAQTPYHPGPGTELQAAPPEQETPAPLPPDEGNKEIESLHEMLRQAREQAEERRKSLQVKQNPRYGDAPMEAYARLSRARTLADVSAAAGYARRRILQLNAAKRTDSDHAEQIQAAINQLQKAVGRAGKKRRELEREKLADSRRLKLERENQLRQAQRLRQELARRKSMRMIRESGYLREAEIDNRLQSQMAETRMELRAQAQALSQAFGPSLDAAVQQYTAQTAAAAPAPSADAGISLQA